MMMNVQTGELVLDDGEGFGPTLTLESFLSSPLARGARKGFGAPGFTNFDVGRRSLDGSALSIVLHFDGERLFMASMGLIADVPKSPEDAWSEEAALATKARHDAWLAAKLGHPPYSHPWGVIESAYDPRSVSSSFAIRYTTTGVAHSPQSSTIDCGA